MAERYTRHMNDRREGRQLYTLPAYARIQPYILRRRSDAACFLSDSVEVTGVEKWLREKRRRLGEPRLSASDHRGLRPHGVHASGHQPVRIRTAHLCPQRH